MMMMIMMLMTMMMEMMALVNDNLLVILLIIKSMAMLVKLVTIVIGMVLIRKIAQTDNDGEDDTNIFLNLVVIM